ncbi:hypothetical protein GM661_00620 [Iocasia frigidifontis]|uniref:Uncharacterized protein n=1 Tax=Iocasia fonsfrigidae TaxID=2682810 RepID=A0A8A7KCG4_9FIRM|nr:hypothetical protein [Iocasia fonsfrigidae]QTL96577.1 hypothetical protein GM661_00620 [Iocasia fonsfrigidae]
MKKIYIYIIIAFILLVVGYFLGTKLAGVVAGILAIFGLGTGKIKKESQEIMDRAEAEKEKTAEIKNNIKNREEKDKKLSKRLNKYFHMLLIFLILFTFSGIGLTEDKPPDIDNLKIPDNYQDLVAAYKDMAMIAIEYQQLYRAAEADNKQLVQSNDNLQQLVEVQKDIIDKLLKSKSNVGVITGVNVVPGDLEHSGLILGLNYNF